MAHTTTKVGMIYVDADCISVGDPVNADRPWDEVLEELGDSCALYTEGSAEPYGPGGGVFIAVPSGRYTVSVVKDRWGEILEIRVTPPAEEDYIDGE